MTQNNFAENELLHALACDRQCAFPHLVEMYNRQLYGYLVRQLQNEQNAEDILQESWIRIYQALERYPQEQIQSLQLRAWLFRIVHNEMKTFMRKKNRSNTISIEDWSELETEHTTLVIEEDIEFKNRREEVRELMLQLSPACRVVLELYLFQELNYQEIAGQLQKPVETVRTMFVVVYMHCVRSLPLTSTRGDHAMDLYTPRGGMNSLPSIDAHHDAQKARILAVLGLAEPTILKEHSNEKIIDALQDNHWERRASAATALGKSHRASLAIVPLIAALKDAQAEVRAAAARALGHVDSATPTLVAALIAALQDQHAMVREAAATALGKSHSASLAIAPLSAALKDAIAEVRAAATQALGSGGTNVPLSSLVLVLRDSDAFVREAAAQALGMLGRIEARLSLLAQVQDEETFVQDVIAQALLRLEEKMTQCFISVLLQEESSVHEMARSAVNSLIDLGLTVHTEVASIAPLVVALQSANKGVQKTVMCYLIGRAFDVLQMNIPLAPLVSILCDESQDVMTRQGVWNTFRSLAQETVREHQRIQLLIAATNDSDISVRKESSEAVAWLIKLTLTLHEERQQVEYEENKNFLYKSQSSLIRWALAALEEREPIEPLLNELREPEAQKRAEVGKKLAKRAKKALMGRIPGGSLIISLKNALGLSPVELEFSDHEKKDEKNNRYVFPWRCTTSPADEQFEYISSLAAGDCPN